MRFLLEIPARYKVAYGGRGGVKSWSFARALLIKGAQAPLRILCAREFQASIKESVHQLLTDQISLMGLDDYYRVLDTEIRGITGTEFFFAGLKQNVTKIKSIEGIDIVWVEEGEKVSANSWSVLIPTVRKEGSEIWVSFNPHEETDPTYKKFIKNPPPEYDDQGRRYSIIVNTGWQDNPWLPNELRLEKDYLARVDKDSYDHVWGGETVKASAAQVMHGKCVLDDFTPGPDWNGPYFGADWGFASDPATLIKSWIHGGKLYVEDEFWGIGVEINDLPGKFEKIDGAKTHVIRADSARPETISYMQKHGFPRIVGAEKWPGSIEDGVSYLRSFEKIVIHPRCVHTDEESRTYKHKIDPLTGDVLPDIVDKNNHCWDPIRYSIEPLIKSRSLPGLFVAGRHTAKRDLSSEINRARENGEPIPVKITQLRRAAMDKWLRGD
jgi:phage terminase large subunit